MKTLAEIDAIMQTIPEPFRSRWCGAENGPCACMGCVQICNRSAMVEAMTGGPFLGDPEYIRESSIPSEIYEQFKITREEWNLWMNERNHT